MKPILIIFLSLFLSVNIQAQTPKAIADSFLNNTPVQATLETQTLDEALKTSNSFRQLARKSLGKKVGYKAALTSTASQQRFQAKAPILGILHKKMLFKSGKHFSLNQGIRLLYEGDILVKVGDKAINQADTKEDIMQYITSVIPFIEVPDLYFTPDTKLNAILLQTVNAGARFGVVGQEIFLKEMEPELMKSNFLQNIHIELISELKGERSTQTGNGKNLLEDPREVIFWIKEELQRQGKSLKKGDLLSLGSITALNPAKPGLKVEAIYKGLGTQNQRVIVFFD